MSDQPPPPAPAPTPPPHGQAPVPGMVSSGRRPLGTGVWVSIVITAILLIGAGIVLAVMLAARDGEPTGPTAATSASAGGEESTQPDDGATSGETTTPSDDATSADVVAPATATANGGIPMGEDGVAGTTNGPDAVEVSVYLDYMCPVCGTFEELNGATLEELRIGGDVTLVLHPVSILDRFSKGTEFSTRAASAAAWVADRAPEYLDGFNAAMFDNQPEEQTAGLTDAQIQELAEDAGVPADVAAGIGDGTATTTFGPWVTAATEWAIRDASGTQGFGTPTILIDGEYWGGDWTSDGELERAITAARS